MITAVVPYARSGIIGAVILGLGRALGETMAVTMLIGNRHEIAASLFAPGYTMAAAIANEFSEAVGDMHLSALAYVAFLLFVVTVLVNAGARLLIWRVARGSGVGEQGAMNRRVLRRLVSNADGRPAWSCAVDRGAAAALLHPLRPGRQGRGQPLAGLLHQDARRRPARPAAAWRTRSSARCSSWARRASSACRSASAPGSTARSIPGSRLTWVTRFVADVLNGTPSIVVGVFAWAWIVATQKHFSALAGSAALAMLMIPMVMRTTEEMIKLVPNSLREAALALGYPRWRTSLADRGAHRPARAS